MHEVELVERSDADRGDALAGDAAGPGPGGSADRAPGGTRAGARAGGAFVRRHRVRRHRVRLVAAGLVVVAALAVGTVRDARADRARAAALALAPAVLDAVDPAGGSGLERWRRPLLDGLVTGDGLVVTFGVTAAGRGGVAAYDAATGEPRWDADVDAVGPQGELTCVLTSGGAGARLGDGGPGAAAADPVGRAGGDAGAGAGAGAGGRAVGGDATVACVAVPAVGKEAWGGLGRRGDVRVVVLDAATGTLVRDDPADRSDVHLTALGPDLVVTRTVPGGAVRVTREDARSGAEAWTSDVDARAADARGPQQAVARVERGLLVVDAGAVRVLDADGDAVDAWPAGVARPDVPVVLAADDGSEPDLTLTARPEGVGGDPAEGDDGSSMTLRAGDAGDAGDAGAEAADARAADAGPEQADAGAEPVGERWTARTPADSVLVVGGRVVTASATGALTARDAESGDVLWASDATTWSGSRASAGLGAVQTDGVHVLVPLVLADGSPVLVAVDPVDGRAAWTAVLPPDVRSVERAGRRLLGRTATEVVALGQD
ncbi:hypothetical protein CCE01nite_32140 [Cellulomonas cellasea]|uniref:Pyrrolo-quinoline quinone repeat domain-containing protein n=3 Tax=Cellulomonas cellasea TaxID=43670 RepID=A0A4Y3L153_9CELL|nr:hypothetical protein CCE01nite_32140 [Cellulomonas cellasea]